MKFTEPESEIKEKHEALFGAHTRQKHTFFSCRCKKRPLAGRQRGPMYFHHTLILLARLVDNDHTRYFLDLLILGSTPSVNLIA